MIISCIWLSLTSSAHGRAANPHKPIVFENTSAKPDLSRFSGHSSTFCHLLLICPGSDVSRVLRPSRPITKHLNIVKYFCSRFFTGYARRWPDADLTLEMDEIQRTSQYHSLITTYPINSVIQCHLGKYSHKQTIHIYQKPGFQTFIESCLVTGKLTAPSRD